jgi:hypothetical protein
MPSSVVASMAQPSGPARRRASGDKLATGFLIDIEARRILLEAQKLARDDGGALGRSGREPEEGARARHWVDPLGFSPVAYGQSWDIMVSWSIGVVQRE